MPQEAHMRWQATESNDEGAEPEMTTRPNANLPAAAANNAVAEEKFVQPRVSVYETTEKVVLELEMPGVPRDKIDVGVDRDELTVTGARPVDAGDCEVLHQERVPLKYRRSFILSEQIASDQIAAAYDNGVLRLTLPKAEGAKPRKIAIE